MSRIGVKAISLPQTVTIEVVGKSVVVKGPKGELTQPISHGIVIENNDGKVNVSRKNNQRQTKAHHGLMRSLVQNMITGVADGYVKKLELVGTGYRVRKQGNTLILNVGYSNPVEYQPSPSVAIETESETVVAISGIDKQKVGHVAAEIRDIRPPEPYKGKGIRYQGEVIRRKAGKSTKA
jgi:large subunit ribosomal protein L6